MPMITVQYATPKVKADLTPQIAATVARLNASILKKDPNVTAINVEESSAASWFIAGGSLIQHHLAAFWIDARHRWHQYARGKGCVRCGDVRRHERPDRAAA